MTATPPFSSLEYVTAKLPLNSHWQWECTTRPSPYHITKTDFQDKETIIWDNYRITVSFNQLRILLQYSATHYNLQLSGVHTRRQCAEESCRQTTVQWRYTLALSSTSLHHCDLLQLPGVAASYLQHTDISHSNGLLMATGHSLKSCKAYSIELYWQEENKQWKEHDVKKRARDDKDTDFA